MAAFDRKRLRGFTAALLAGACLCLGATVPALAQQSAAVAGIAPIAANDDARMLLRANELVYNQDTGQVTAVGGVQIYYNRYRLVASRVRYDQKSGRVTAQGNIELIEPGGNRVYADELDVTDDFGEGFLNALRVETTDNTRLAAESAERQQGDMMVLNRAVYTACLPCEDKPGKAPLWQVKAERVVRNGATHTIRLENARFELFGMPIGVLPFLEVPDETVARKSGLLFPQFSASDNLGFGVTVPYYHVFSPSMDATISPTYYTNQGLLIQGEVRNRFETGEHTFRFAGINQRNPETFDKGTSDRLDDTRLMAASKAEFQINPRWTFGWDVMVQSDNNFSRTYELKEVSSDTFTNDIHLTGLGKRNHFDLHAFYFNVQDKAADNLLERRQAVVYPVLDYSYYAPEPVAGGELSLNFNTVNLSRRDDDWYNEGITNRFPGLEGSFSRFTAEAEWKRMFNIEGLLLTPSFAARGDVTRHTGSGLPAFYEGSMRGEGAHMRGMLTAGLEARYPILVTFAESSHVIEPVAQLFLRNNEQYAGGLPNEDAQSFVFDATTLFERDKFSGYDRIEGGNRLNAGLRYTGSYDNGLGVRAIFGQSYHLGGLNSFATEDLVQAGANSGLESKRSDYVAMAALDLPNGFTIGANARFDDETLAVKRTDASVSFTTPRVQGSLIYTQVDPQPEYGSKGATDVIKATTSLRINENWTLSGTGTWDLADKEVVRRGIGISYVDECFILTVAYSDKPSSTVANDWTIGARLSFRTLGDVNIGSTDDYSENFRY